MTRGKVVLVSFPFDDFSTQKVRPAVCLTEPIGEYHQVIVAFITSRIPMNLLDSDLVVLQTHPEFSATGLHITSTLRLHRLLTVPTSIVLREIGVMPEGCMREISRKLAALFNIS